MKNYILLILGETPITFQANTLEELLAKTTIADRWVIINSRSLEVVESFGRLPIIDSVGTYLTRNNRKIEITEIKDGKAYGQVFVEGLCHWNVNWYLSGSFYASGEPFGLDIVQKIESK